MNRGDYRYKKAKATYLKAREQWGGWWICDLCYLWTVEPELDHIQRVGMGGSEKRLLDVDNWQILCRDCHHSKDGGMRIT